MPRRDGYLTDDDDDPRRAAPSGGGVPGWVWAAAGGGVLLVLVVGGLWFARTNQREAAIRHEVARAEVARAAVRKVDVQAEPNGIPGLPAIRLEQITNAYKDDRQKADAEYPGRPFRVRVRITSVGEGWVGTSADFGAGGPRDMVPNVLFYQADGNPGGAVTPGRTVVIEGTCAGLSPRPTGGDLLVFTDCRVVNE